MESSEPAPDVMVRFRRWAAIAVAVAVLGYVGYAVWKGLSETTAELAGFSWGLYLPVIGLTGVNYGLRYLKWNYLLERLGIHVPHRVNIWIFLAGLAMVISPAKAGEILKPYLVRVCADGPVVRTVPALVVERGTDGLSVVILAAIGVSTYYAEARSALLWTIGLSFALVGAISIRPLAIGILHAVAKFEPLKNTAARLEDVYEATRVCLEPAPFLITMVLSLVAWVAECVGYWLVFRGLGVHTTIGAATFLYAFATVFGAPSPGGMGMADAALVEGAVSMIDTITGPQALAASLLIRIATLWLGVGIGAVALLRIETVIADARANHGEK
ncbi:MAG: lysylphosphatidylglycerol synthase transmembrane domain-containing protein [Myxococcota bacterium]